MTPNRDHDGQFATAPVARIPLWLGLQRYNECLDDVCRHKGFTSDWVAVQLTRPTSEIRRGSVLGPGAGKASSKFSADHDWLKAVYARQLALYLANTLHGVQQKMLAQIAGLTPAAVCLALQEIEDLRDHRNYEKLIELITIETKARTAIGDRAP